MKIPPEKTKNLPEKIIQNSFRENSKSSREKIWSKIFNIFFHAFSGTVAGLFYGDFSLI